ncbi:MAG: hypothetical protein KR126chlam1_00881 [Chlamydiae bacterium]|nr:hypothetical protein [Chlamydiota bacterium]
MKKGFFIFLVCLLWVATLPAMMTKQNYVEVMLGMTVPEVTRIVGEPYAVHDLGDGVQEYQYIERFSMNNELLYETHYILTVVNGQVVNKRTCNEYRPPYDRMYQADPNYPSFP